MTLASKTADKTADILALATQGINLLISGQDALASTDERKFVLTQLATAMQTAAKLADVAHMVAIATHGSGAVKEKGDTEGLMTEGIIRAETQRLKAMAEAVAVTEKVGKDAERAVAEKTERIKAETEKLSKEVEKSVAETARLHAEAEKVGRETERTKAEAERAVAEMDRLKAEAMMVRSVKLKIDAETERAKVEMHPGATKAAKEAERAIAETERLKAEAVVVGGDKIKNDPETERVKAETEWTSVQDEWVDEEGESSGQVHEGYWRKSEKYLEELGEQIERKKRQMRAEGNYLRWVGLRDELGMLNTERDTERLRRIQQSQQ